MTDERNRLGIFLPSLEAGGAEAVVTTLANQLVRRGYSVELLLASKRGPYLQRLDPAVYIEEVGGGGVLAAIPGLVRYLRRRPPRSLLSVMSHANVAALIAHRLAFSDVPLVISERMSLAARSNLYDGVRERLLVRLMRLFYRRASAVIAVSQMIAEEIQQRLGVSKGRVHVLPSPLVSDQVLSASREEPAVAWWPVPGEGPLILAAGRLSAVKDYELLIRAFARLRRQRPVRLLILGEGEQRPALEQLVRKLGLGAEVALPGFVSNPFAFMARADLFVLSSRFEGLPGVLVQAMACGTPVVSTDCQTGPREILEDGRWGRLVPTGDQHALSAAMASSLDEPVPDVAVRAQAFREEASVDAYLDVLLGRAGTS